MLWPVSKEEGNRIKLIVGEKGWGGGVFFIFFFFYRVGEYLEKIAEEASDGVTKASSYLHTSFLLEIYGS